MGQKVYQFLVKGIQEGLSGTEIMKILREKGLGYRLQDFYNDLRILKGEIQKWDTMRFVPKEKIISERLYTPTTSPLPTKFSTIFRIDYYDPETGKKNSSYITIHHDTPMRRQDLEEMAMKTFLEGVEDYTGQTSVQILKIVPERGFKRI